MHRPAYARMSTYLHDIHAFCFSFLSFPLVPGLPAPSTCRSHTSSRFFVEKSNSPKIMPVARRSKSRQKLDIAERRLYIMLCFNLFPFPLPCVLKSFPRYPDPFSVYAWYANAAVCGSTKLGIINRCRCSVLLYPAKPSSRVRHACCLKTRFLLKNGQILRLGNGEWKAYP